MKKLALAFGVLLAGSAFAAGCSADNPSSEEKNDKLKVYTTIFPLKDFTEKIGGDLVEVESVYPANADAHSFEPTTKTMVKMAESDAFIYTGAGIEGFADKAAETIKNEEAEIVKAADGIELIGAEEHNHEEEAHSEEEHNHEEEAHSEEEHNHEEDAHSEEEHNHEEDAHSEEEGHTHGDKDPHVWLDPIRSIQMAENIKDALVKKDPEHKEEYEKNFSSLKAELEKLDQEFKSTLTELPKKEILVSHAAYGYWTERYGIEQISVMGLSSSEEPSQKEIKNIIEEAKTHKIQHIIFEQNVSNKISKVVQNEIGAEPLTISNLESVTDEDMKNKEDYFSLMRENLTTLKTALSGS
ncbi:adhesin [Bacillus mangrovi]|uniref:Adhesin n=1 Tax=Metabacillus mangrovi TaxID=1491830 RepID=A0A7X2S6Z9_9BACI|nr:zinc ABC transporter substrate-binding protein [Metabacillus mangrovi]MTH54430.1 adhesin [Metabacillus mangrovi]